MVGRCVYCGRSAAYVEEMTGEWVCPKCQGLRRMLGDMLDAKLEKLANQIMESAFGPRVLMAAEVVTAAAIATTVWEHAPEQPVYTGPRLKR